MTIPPVNSDPQTYKPTTTQQDRLVAIRRFNWFYVYVPIGLAGLAVLLLVVLLFWGTLSPNITGTREFTSGLADIIVILTIMPLLVLCLIVPIAVVGLFIYREQQPKREYGRFQSLLWRSESLVGKTSDKVNEVVPKTATPIIEGHARLAYWRTLVENIKRAWKNN